MIYTLKDVADFCYVNKGRRAFVKHSLYGVQMRVIEAYDANTLHLVESPTELLGVCIGKPHHAKKVVHIEEIVCKGTAFRTFVKEVFARYPGYLVTGYRQKTKQRELKTFTERNLWAAALQA